MFSSPFLAKCSDRSSMPKSHPSSGAPEDWFSDEMLERHNLLGLTFDFFVDWSKNPPPLTPVVWIKEILDPSYSYSDINNNLNEIFDSHFDDVYLKLLDNFIRNYSIKVQFIVFRDDYDWDDEDSSLLLVTFLGKTVNGFEFKGEIVRIGEFKELIQKLSGGPINIGSKGLIYGTSKLECYLSRTTSLYPGDVDLIVFNKKFQPLALLEFKKHTLSSSISGQKLSNYYPKPDGRKYNRLAILRDYLSSKGFTPPLFNIYYPTKSFIKEGKMELVKGSAGKLYAKVGSRFTLPKINEVTEYDKIIIKLKKAISYNKRLEKK